jgi:N6-L-threonylcarbamoyladenine synthase
MLVLGIETSCDETAAAVADETGRVLSSVVASQLALHGEYGGVVPELASRQHLRDLPRVADQALAEAQVGWDQVSGLAATHGPGLMGALLVGLSWAKAAAWARALPFKGVNHLEGHLKAIELNTPPAARPLVGLVASGGHTNLYWVGPGTPTPFRLLAQTRDDAVGEAFDKVAKLLDMPYPGGPSIEKAARQAAPGVPAKKFTPPRLKDGSLGFSYSGLKTAVRLVVENAKQSGRPLDAPGVARAFQKTVVDDLVNKTLQAARETHARGVALTGGVAANGPLREALTRAAAAAGLECFIPPRAWCTDNAAMIAAVGAQHLAAGERDGWDLPAVPYLEL